MNFFENFSRCYLIAEIGVNHNGDVELARKMIEAAKAAGADAVKFQTFRAQNLVTAGTPKVEYQKRSTHSEESHYDMLERLELNVDEHISLKEFCDLKEIDYLSTPYDIESVQFLNNLGVKFFKTASADIVDLPLQRSIAMTGKPAAVSVGMASLGEIEEVIQLYREFTNENIILLHCVSNYPCSDESLNLKVMETLHKAFGVPVGYSDHSIGFEAAVISLVYGSRIIEKHFTLDKKMPGPDHAASSTQNEFKALVCSVRRAEKMMGNSIKICQKEELQMATVSRKSIVLAKDAQGGEVLSREHLAMKRPGTGLASKFLPQILGRKVKISLKAGTQIHFNDLL